MTQVWQDEEGEAEPEEEQPEPSGRIAECPKCGYEFVI